MKPAWSIKSKSFARYPLGDALEGVISGIVALEARVNLNPLLATLSGARAQGEAQSTRLREVLDRDRALVAAGTPLRAVKDTPNPALVEPEPEPAPPKASTPASVSARAATCTEPIRTRTMARLLAGQGHKQRALSIYDFLLASDSDPELRAEAERLRAQAG